MKLIVLAAGEGSRLRPMTLEKPKCLVEVDGRPLLDHQLEVVRALGVDDIVLIKGYLADTWRREGTREYINPRFAETNMVWTLFCARNELGGGAIVSYGDIVYSTEALRRVITANHDITVVIDRDWRNYWEARFADPLEDAETLVLDEDGRITNIGQKPHSITEIQGQYIGLMKFSAAGMHALSRVFDDAVERGAMGDKPVERAYMTDLIQAVIDDGHAVHAAPIDGGWIEVDSIHDLNLPVTRERLAGIRLGIPPRPGASS